MRLTSTLTALCLALAACATNGVGSGSYSADLLDQAYVTGVNQVGLESAGAEAWHGLATEACDTGAWDHDVARQLAKEFLAEHGEGSSLALADMSRAVWLVAVGLCRDLFPEDSLRVGPPEARSPSGPAAAPTA